MKVLEENIMLKKTVEFTNKVANKTTQMFKKIDQNVLDQVKTLEQEYTKKLIEKSILSKVGVSNGKLTGVKKDVFYKEFRDKMFKRDRFAKNLSGNVDFTPARKLLEFKLQHSFRISFFYLKKEDKTYVFVCDNGYFDWTKIAGGDYEGNVSV